MTDAIALKGAGIKIGRGEPCFLVAEIGINHNGDMSLAREMIVAAKESGAHAVKFQNYQTEDFILPSPLTYTYSGVNGEVTENQYEMFKRLEISQEQVLELKAFSDAQGIVFFSTPTGDATLGHIIDANVDLLKNGSDFLNVHDLIASMGRSKVPTIISTGMATELEVAASVDAFYRGGGQELIILHCTSSYPTPPVDVNLRRMLALEERFNCLVGFSDHTSGNFAALSAVAMGAVMVEKHFTINRALPGPDHMMSSTPDEFAALSRDLRILETISGDRAIEPAASEKHGRETFRLSCVATTDLSIGTVITRENVGFSRPGDGIPSSDVDMICGARLTANMRKGDKFTWTAMSKA